MSANPAATIVVPTRHEEDNIDPFVQRLGAALAGRQAEVLVVDDSDDRATISAVEAAARRHGSPELTINHYHRDGERRHGGLSGAVIDGIRRAQASTIVVMDADLQHPPETVPELLDRIDSGKQLVVASRYREGGSSHGLDSFRRRLVSLAATGLTRVLFPRGLRGITDPMTGFFAVRRDALDVNEMRPRGFKVLLEILARHTDLVRDEVPLQFAPRHAGQSKADEGNGREFLKQLPALRIQTLPTSVNFMLGGGLIALLGVLLFWGLVHMGMSPRMANPVELAVTLGLNFVYSRSVTWRGQPQERLAKQVMWFLATRIVTLGIAWLVFEWLLGRALHYQLANIIGLSVGAVLNFWTSRAIFEKTKQRQRPRIGRRALQITLVFVMLAIASGLTYGWRPTLFGFILLYAIFNLVTSSMEVRWRLYGRRDPEARERMKFPEPVPVDQAKTHFFLIVPALDEAAVIGETLYGLVAQTHPLTRIVVTLAEGDIGTIAVADTVAAMSDRVSVIVKSYDKSSKPQQLNAALAAIEREVAARQLDPASVYVGVFDAEDDVPKELLAHVEALIDQTGADVIQGGVQLTNLDLPMPEGMSFWRRQGTKLRGWFCVHNVMEYFFWFSSRMFYQVEQGFVPFGGNTLLIRLAMLARASGWPLNLTEDCALGVKLCTQYNAKVVAAYDPKLATREETPAKIFGRGGLDHQRERWDQGFGSVFGAGEWLDLPSWRERLMAAYILGMPYIQAANALMIPVSLLALFLLVGPVGLVLVMYLPFVPIVMTIVLQIVGLGEFSREFGEKAKLRHYLSLVIGSYPYQLLLAKSALSAIWRRIRKLNDWRLTRHDGLHRPIGSLVSNVKGSVA